MKIIFTGDLSFRGVEHPSREQAECAFAELLPVFASADLRVVNLETPLADRNRYQPIPKSGPNLIGAQENIVYPEALHTDLCTLANNHIGDYGEGAALDTLSLLDEHGIAHIGAGKNKAEAYRAFRWERDGIRISILSVCENEFGMADETHAGSAGYDLRLLFSRIREEKECSDRVIVCFHGGSEHMPVPSPGICERYRLLIDMGADAVIGGHPHCPQGMEYYRGRPIVYSMGNFLFHAGSPKTVGAGWYCGYLAACEITENGIRVEPIPYCFAEDDLHMTLFAGKEKEEFLAYFSMLSGIIGDAERLKNLFSGWAWLHPWVASLPGYGADAAPNYDLMSCEAHNELGREVLRIRHFRLKETAETFAAEHGTLTVGACLPWITRYIHTGEQQT